MKFENAAFPLLKRSGWTGVSLGSCFVIYLSKYFKSSGPFKSNSSGGFNYLFNSLSQSKSSKKGWFLISLDPVGPYPSLLQGSTTKSLLKIEIALLDKYWGIGTGFY